MECFPSDDFTIDDIKRWIVELWKADLIQCYEHAGKGFFWVTGWEKHQKIDRPSFKYPPLDEHGRPVKFDERSTIDPRVFDEHSTDATPRNGMESKGREWNGELDREGVPSLPQTADGVLRKCESANGANPSKASAKRKTYPATFEAWWNAYPRKVGKLNALRAYVRAVKRIAADRDLQPADAHQGLLAAAQRYGEAVRDKEPQFIAHPATWLNGGRWDDDDGPPDPRAQLARIQEEADRIRAQRCAR